MEHADLIIKNARVLTSTSDRVRDIAIRDGVFVDVAEVTPHTAQIVDATGRIVTPGGVDVHAHIEQLSGMGVMNADTFETATRSAALGGTTSVVSFAPQSTSMRLTQSIEDYSQRARRGAFIDYAFHIIVSDIQSEHVEADLRQLIQAGHRSIKIFTTYNIQLSDRDICEVLGIAKEEGALVCVHAENDGLIGWTKDRLLAGGKVAPKHHAISHPRLAEIEAVERLIRFAEYFATPVMLFHISTAEAVSVIQKARGRGVPIWAETCPHYLLMTAEVLDKPGTEGAKWMCSPPQRTLADHGALWSGLEDGTLDLVSSDHAPYRADESGKFSNGRDVDFSKIANGLPGLQLRMPLMFDAMQRGQITSTNFVTTCCTKPAQVHGLSTKGDIALGLDADLVVWDPDREWLCAEDDLSDNVGYNPWSGTHLEGVVDTVISRGEIIVANGRLKADPGRGVWQHRSNIGVKSSIPPAAEYVSSSF